MGQAPTRRQTISRIGKLKAISDGARGTPEGAAADKGIKRLNAVLSQLPPDPKRSLCFWCANVEGLEEAEVSVWSTEIPCDECGSDRLDTTEDWY